MIQPTRRKALQADKGRFKWIIFFALQVSIILLLLEAQQASNQRMPHLFRAGHTPDHECTCGHCKQCQSNAEREYDYGR